MSVCERVSESFVFVNKFRARSQSATVLPSNRRQICKQCVRPVRSEWFCYCHFASRLQLVTRISKQAPPYGKQIRCRVGNIMCTCIHTQCPYITYAVLCIWKCLNNIYIFLFYFLLSYTPSCVSATLCLEQSRLKGHFAYAILTLRPYPKHHKRVFQVTILY